MSWEGKATTKPRLQFSMGEVFFRGSRCPSEKRATAEQSTVHLLAGTDATAQEINLSLPLHTKG